MYAMILHSLVLKGLGLSIKESISMPILFIGNYENFLHIIIVIRRRMSENETITVRFRTLRWVCDRDIKINGDII